MAHSRQPRGPVWVDMLNSPNVHFMRPILAELRRREVPYVVTIRDFAQTRALCNLFGIEHSVIGVHGGRSLIGKSTNLLARVRELRRFARQARPSMILTHNSYSQLAAGWTLGLPSVTTMDYEYQPANHLAFRCATRVFLPDVLPKAIVRRQGAAGRKTWWFHGLKEHISLAGFEPDPDYLRGIGVNVERIVVVVRPPADFALYHRFENVLFRQVLDWLKARDDAAVLLFPRTDAQRDQLAAQGYEALIWAGETLDGLNLVAGADLVVSAGGSMNREAAVLGTPAYSVYAGKLGGVDKALIRVGRLRLISAPELISCISLAKKRSMPTTVDTTLLTEFVDRALAVLSG